ASALGVQNLTNTVNAQITDNHLFGLTASQIAAGPNTKVHNVFLSTAPALDTSHPWAQSPWDQLISGGSGADVLAGTPGRDLIIGGGGNDSLSGGTGADTFLYAQGAVTISDFSHSDGDKIDLTNVPGIYDRDDFAALASQNGPDTFADFGNGNTLTLQ